MQFSLDKLSRMLLLSCAATLLITVSPHGEAAQARPAPGASEARAAGAAPARKARVKRPAKKPTVKKSTVTKSKKRPGTLAQGDAAPAIEAGAPVAALPQAAAAPVVAVASTAPAPSWGQPFAAREYVPRPNPYLPAPSAPAAVSPAPAGGAAPPQGMRLALPQIPLFEQSILPKVKTVYPTGEKPLVVVTFKCPTELVGIDTPSTVILHKAINGGMDLVNRTNLLSFNMQQVCQ